MGMDQKIDGLHKPCTQDSDLLAGSSVVKNPPASAGDAGLTA